MAHTKMALTVNPVRFIVSYSTPIVTFKLLPQHIHKYTYYFHVTIRISIYTFKYLYSTIHYYRYISLIIYNATFIINFHQLHIYTFLYRKHYKKDIFAINRPYFYYKHKKKRNQRIVKIFIDSSFLNIFIETRASTSIYSYYLRAKYLRTSTATATTIIKPLIMSCQYGPIPTKVKP